MYQLLPFFLNSSASHSIWWSIVYLGLGIAGGTVIAFVAKQVIVYLVGKKEPALAGSLRVHFRFSHVLLAILLTLNVLQPLIIFAEPWDFYFNRSLQILLVVVIAWLSINGVAILQDSVHRAYDINVKDNLSRRRVRTQFQFVKRFLIIGISLIAIALIFMSFDRARQLGASMLASAGVAGIILGFAAQRSIANLVAGLQIAFTQPIRIDDVVIVEGEWGKIEEINLTYIVVRIWDLRRLVLPISYFIEQPFQNWTRNESEILGTVFLHLDFSVPVDEIREELHRVLSESALWDKKVWGLQVTDTSDRTMELRALMSAPDAGSAWDLRCHVRERLIDYVQQKHPSALPKHRADLKSESRLSA